MKRSRFIEYSLRKGIKLDNKKLIMKGEQMSVKDFRLMIKKAVESDFISIQQLEKNIKAW